jgi:pimeloyl-ACP methyl ester carboxylesterase
MDNLNSTPIATSHGRIAGTETGSGRTAVVFVHGNSSSKEIFEAQLRSPLLTDHHLVALDLPGHGQSEDAADPQRTYTLPGYASAVREVLGALGIERPILVGWSLGGHIAIELLAGAPRPLGVVLTGTPPFGKSHESVGAAFRPTPLMMLTGKPEFTDEDALAYARATTTADVAPGDPRHLAARRTDGRARARMVAAVGEGLGVDQLGTVEEVDVPLCIVNGADDPFLNPDFFTRPRYARLWRGQVHRIPGTGHAPFAEQPEVYNQLLRAFCADVTAGAAR